MTLVRLTIHAAAAATLAACASAPAVPPPAPTPPMIQPVPVAAAMPSIDTAPPVLGAPPELRLPPVITRELPNGLRLLVVEHREIPVADFVLVLGTGGEADPRGKPGVATLTASLLKEGAGTRSSLQIADQEAFLGVNIGTNASWDVTNLSLHTPTARLDSALALFADVALRPTFPAKELDRLRQDRLTTLLQIRDQGPAIADRAYASLVFGGAHPYGRSLIGTEAAARAITRADIRGFYQRHYRPNNATLIVVGDVSADDIERRITALFGGWQRGTVAPTPLREPPAAAARTIYIIDKPGAPQSSFRIGGVGVPRATEDYFALLVANTILGGSFTSRLNANLRERKGYTYGAQSGFSMRRGAGPFTARAEIVRERTDSALVEFMKELAAIRDTVPATELEKAKRYLQLQMPSRFETTGDIASQLVPVVVYGLPLDYYNSYVRNVEAVTQADVQRVAQRYIDPAKMTVVIVGDRSQIESAVRALDLGNVELRDITGQPLATPAVRR